jgi:protein O-GlcNAc transferase
MTMITRLSKGGGFGRRPILIIMIRVALFFLATIPAFGQPAQDPASPSTADYLAELIIRADIAWDNARYDEAADAYRQAFLVDPSNGRAAYRLGWCYNEQKKYGDAIWALKDAVLLAPTDEKARVELGFAYRNAERYQEALETYRTILTITPKSVDAYYSIGWILNERGDYAPAIDALKEVVRLDPERGEAFEGLGYAYRKSGKFDDSLAAYSKAASVEPDKAGPLKALGDIYFSDLRQLDKAAMFYQELLKLDPDDTASQYNLGWALNELGKSDEAIGPLSRVTQLEPRNIDAWNELGFAFRNTKQNGPSFEAYSRSLKLEPDCAPAHFGLADLLFYNVQDYTAAIDEYIVGLNLQADGKAFRNLGTSYNALTRYADSVRPLEKAAKLRPEDSRVYLELAIAYEELNRMSDALTAYQNAVRLAPQSAEAQSRLNRNAVRSTAE